MRIKRYGWAPDPPDHRDLKFNLSRAARGALPPTVDPRANQPPIRDQGELGSCTGHGMAATLECGNVRNGEPLVPLSRLMAYYNARRLDGTTAYDSGASIRSVVKAAARWGCCPEDCWPYDIAKFMDQPSRRCYSEARSSLVLKYERVAQDRDALRAVLAAGLDIVFGFTVYESFEDEYTARTGIVRMPGRGEHAISGHCVRAIGYTDVALPDVPARHFICANSWGSDWGLKGYFALPYEYMISDDLAADFWVVKKVA